MDIQQQQQQWEVDSTILKLNQHELREAILRICKTEKRENVGIIRTANLVLADIAHRKELEAAGVHMALPPYQESPTAAGTTALKRCRKCKQDFVDEAGSRGGCSFHDGELQSNGKESIDTSHNIMTWSCCNLHSARDGCKTRDHVAEGSLARKFRELKKEMVFPLY